MNAGLAARIRADVRVLDEGRVLVGGSPLTLLRLSEQARDRIRDGVVVVEDDISAQIADRLLATNIADPVIARQTTPERLTVVVPVRDRAARLDRLLGLLAPRLRCVVVDDGSDQPATIAAVVSKHAKHANRAGPGVELVVLDRNRGPAAARNAGLRRVSTALVAFVDSDVVVWPAQLLALTAQFADPAVTLVAPRVRSRIEGPRRWFHPYEAEAGSLDLGSRGAAVRPGAAVGWLPSACLVARTAALGPGFDAGLRVGEDVDLVWRLVAAGDRVRYEPGVVVEHDARARLVPWMARKFVYGTGGAELARRHPAAPAAAVLAPWPAAAAAATLARSPVALPLVAVSLVSSTRRLRRRIGPPHGATATALAAEGLVWALRQEVALLLRHWWPAALLGAARSRPVRRALVSALVVDIAIMRYERPRVPLLRGWCARRLDDLAYGAGLWTGAVRARSVGALRIRLVGGAARPRGAGD